MPGSGTEVPLEPPEDPPEDEPPEDEPPDEDPPDDELDEVSGARFWTVQATTRDERAKNETSARIMAHGRARRVPPRFFAETPDPAANARVVDDAIEREGRPSPRHA